MASPAGVPDPRSLDTLGCQERTAQVPGAVLAVLRDLEPRDGGQPAAVLRDPQPRSGRFLAAAHPGQQPCPVGGDSLGQVPIRPRWPRGAPERGVVAVERVVVAATAGERATERADVAGMCGRPRFGHGQPRRQLHQQPPERDDVLPVVLRDLPQHRRAAGSEVLEVAVRDQRARQVSLAQTPAMPRSTLASLRVRQPVLPELSRERQQVQVAGVRGCRLPLEPVARDEQRPVERAPVVRHQPGVRRDLRRQGGEERRLVRLVRRNSCAS